MEEISKCNTCNRLLKSWATCQCCKYFDPNPPKIIVTVNIGQGLIEPEDNKELEK